MFCMHREQAPCEVVCPVGATVHDAEGLNVMVYNRCIGTRFCSNTVLTRSAGSTISTLPGGRRGLSRRATQMSRCAPAACWRSPRSASSGSPRRASPPIGATSPVGEVVTACQVACPTRAFMFGNLAERDSEVVRRKQSPLDYALLEDQNTHPRVTYAVIRNPNPAISCSGT